MIDIQKKNSPTNNNTMNPIAAGIAGAVAGGMAVAAAVIMSDKKNQKKVGDALKNAKIAVTEKVDGVVKDSKKTIKAKI